MKALCEHHSDDAEGAKGVLNLNSVNCKEISAVNLRDFNKKLLIFQGEKLGGLVRLAL